MNKLLLTGRPTTDPNISYVGEGEESTTIAKFTIAVRRVYKKSGDAAADFIQCAAFGRTAKNIADYVKKGQLIEVTGRLENNNYTNKNGEKVFGFQMKIETVGFLEKKQSDDLNMGEGYMELPEGADLPFECN